MSNQFKILLMLGLGFMCFQAVAAKQTLLTKTDKLSYTIGFEMGQNFKNQNVTLNTPSLQKGLEDGLTGKKALLTKAQRRTLLTSLKKQIIDNKEKVFKKLADNNLKQGTEFLAANKQKPGVVTLPSGLQYKILKKGVGPQPKAEDSVTVNYSGTLINGKVFDSSYKRGQPATFAVTQVIKGWQEALQLMHTGASWEIVIPADLAYGQRGAGSLIGPNEALIFKVDLISINKK